MSTGNEYWGKRVLFLITGASRGLGRVISTSLAERLPPDSKSFFILIARDEKKLEDVRSSLLSVNNAGDGRVSVHITRRDLSKPSAEDFTNIINTALSSHNHKAEDFDRVFLIHNAGSVGDITKECKDFKDLGEIQSYFDFNLVSVMLLTSVFLEIFKQSNGRIVILNISSLAATEAFKGLSLYCTGKAARYMYFKVLALENPNIRVLNYSPGPLQTDMGDEILERGPQEMREQFKEMKAKGEILKCETTVNKLLGILEKDEYQSGINIDFYDRV